MICDSWVPDMRKPGFDSARRHVVNNRLVKSQCQQIHEHEDRHCDEEDNRNQVEDRDGDRGGRGAGALIDLACHLREAELEILARLFLRCAPGERQSSRSLGNRVDRINEFQSTDDVSCDDRRRCMIVQKV